jgi:hypothetical protein
MEGGGCLALLGSKATSLNWKAVSSVANLSSVAYSRWIEFRQGEKKFLYSMVNE